MYYKIQEMTTVRFPMDSALDFAAACGVTKLSEQINQAGTRDAFQDGRLPSEAAAMIFCALHREADRNQMGSLAEEILRILEQGAPEEIEFSFEEEDAIRRQAASQLERRRGAALTEAEQQLLREGTYLPIGLAAYACLRAGRSIRMADVATAMNLEAIRGELGAFDARLHELARPFPGQIQCAANVRCLTEGSKLVTEEGRRAYGYDKKPRVQDAICVRATPQTHGGVRDVFHWACRQVQTDLLQQAEHPYRTEYACNALGTALADLAHISERRSFRLDETKLSYGLPMNLVPDELGINYGFPIIQSTQAAEVAELKLLTLPDAAVKCCRESQPYSAASRILRILMLLDRVLAVEILMSAQGMDIVQAKIPDFPAGRGTSAVRARLRREVTLMDENRFAAPDMQEAERLVADGFLAAAAGTLQ